MSGWSQEGVDVTCPINEINLEQLRCAQQEDTELVTVVAWVHGRRPSREEVEACSSDLQRYYQLLPYIYVDGVGLLRVSQVHPGETPRGRLVIPIHSEIRESIFQQGHVHTLGGHLEDRASFWSITNRYFWPRLEVEIAHRLSSCKVCNREAEDRRTYPLIRSINAEGEKPIKVISRDEPGVTEMVSYPWYALGIQDLYQDRALGELWKFIKFKRDKLERGLVDEDSGQGARLVPHHNMVNDMTGLLEMFGRVYDMVRDGDQLTVTSSQHHQRRIEALLLTP